MYHASSSLRCPFTRIAFSQMSTAPIDTGALRARLQRQLEGMYVIERELGGAGSSHVFLATEVALDRSVVLKVLPPELARIMVDADVAALAGAL